MENNKQYKIVKTKNWWYTIIDIKTWERLFLESYKKIYEEKDWLIKLENTIKNDKWNIQNILYKEYKIFDLKKRKYI